jgi:hypothetical protein
MPIINEQSIKEACERLAQTLIQKNHDYGNSVEEQFKEYGDSSINLRLEDKLRRLKNLSKNPAQVNEKKSETVLDSAGYAVLAYILYDRMSLDEPCEGPDSSDTIPEINFRALGTPNIPEHVKTYGKYDNIKYEGKGNLEAYFSK